jgi:hypothetical protein
MLLRHPVLAIRHQLDSAKRLSGDIPPHVTARQKADE